MCCFRLASASQFDYKQAGTIAGTTRGLALPWPPLSSKGRAHTPRLTSSRLEPRFRFSGHLTVEYPIVEYAKRVLVLLLFCPTNVYWRDIQPLWRTPISTRAALPHNLNKSHPRLGGAHLDYDIPEPAFPALGVPPVKISRYAMIACLHRHCFDHVV